MRAADVLLADGSTVHVRPISPDDADATVALHSRFSDRTRYLRYFSPYPRIPSRDLARFVNVDHRDREALVVALGDDLIAVGQYERLGPEAADAEVALVVEDAHQRRGVASLLLEHLAAAARDAGMTRFVAEVLPENGAMLRVFADAGYQLSRKYADGVVHLTFPIAPTSRSVRAQRAREHVTEAASVARLLAPRSVAVYGVRRDGTGVGTALVRHVIEGGFSGPVYPIHPSASTLEGLTAFTAASDAPGPVDLALVAVPASQMSNVVEDAAKAGALGLVVLSAGFAESGDAGVIAQRELVAAARGSGLRIVGPNGLGVVNTDPAVRLNASLAPALAERGRVGLFCQSAALGVAILAEAHARGVGLSSFVSVGNRADVSGNDLLQYWFDDPHTDVVLMYLETFGNPRKFARIARALGRDKPIVAVAAGAAGSPGAAPAGAASGPAWPAVGAAAPDSQAMTALFAHSSVIRVETVNELFDVGQLLARQPLPAGRRVGIVGNAAALVALASGACARAGLEVSPRQLTVAPDVPPAAAPGQLGEALRAALVDAAADSVIVVVAPPLPASDVDRPGGDPPRVYRSNVDQSAHVNAIVAAAEGADKPVVVVVIGAVTAPGDLPIYPTVEEAVRALDRVARYAEWRREPLGSEPELPNVDVEAAERAVAARATADELLAAYGVGVVPAREVAGRAGVLAAAADLGYPVALKAAGPEVRHRLDLGAVRLDLAKVGELRRAYSEISKAFGPRVLVQPMAQRGVVCAIEMFDDPAFGPVVGFGLGGVAAEVVGDLAWRAAPLTDVDAAALVRAPRAAALLHGYRGSPPVDTAALADLLTRVGQLADDWPEVKRLVLNPVLAHAGGLSVLHATVNYGDAAARPDTGPRRLG